MFFVFDGIREKLHSCHAPVGFGSDQQVQIGLLCTSIAVSRGDGDLAKDSLDSRDPFYAIALADCNNSIRLLDRRDFFKLETNSRFATDFRGDKRAYLARSSLGIARDALVEAMLTRRVPIAARSFFRGAVQDQSLHFLPRLDRRRTALIRIMRGFGLGVWPRHPRMLPGPSQSGGRAGHSFEPPEDHIAIAWIIFDEAGKPP